MPRDPEQIRSFIAVELPSDVKEGLAGLRKKLERSEHGFVKWVDPGGIHLTLKFLGNIPSKRVAEITEALGEAVQGVPPFRLEISGLGAFPNFKQIRVFWVGIGGEFDKLLKLKQNIESSLAALGFDQDERPFTPHLTLARIRENASSLERRNFGELVGSIVFESKYEISVNAISLMKSVLTPAGAIYSRLSEIPLKP